MGQAIWYDEEFERHLITAADAVYAINEFLAERLRGLGANAVEIVGNGLKPGLEVVWEPRPLARGEVTVGYFGYLAGAWFDWELIAEAARRRPSWRFYLIGYGGSPEGIRLPDTVELLGKQPQTDLAAFAANWDVATIPFKPDRLAAGADPIKTYEYLAMGLPVVATGVYPPAGGEAFVTRAEGVRSSFARSRRRGPGRGGGGRGPPRLCRLVHLGPPSGVPARLDRAGAAAGGGKTGPFREPPVKVLFVYKYLTLGGVEAVLRARLDGLSRPAIEAHAWFFYDLGALDFRRPGGAGPRGDGRGVPRFRAGAGVRPPLVDRHRGGVPGFDGTAGPARTRLRVPLGLPRKHRVSAGPRGLAARGRLHSFRGPPADGPGEPGGMGWRSSWSPTLCGGVVKEPRAVPCPSGSAVAAWIGRLDTLKNWEGFVEVLADLGRQGTEVEGWIIGKPVGDEGPEKLLERARLSGCSRGCAGSAPSPMAASPDWTPCGIPAASWSPPPAPSRSASRSRRPWPGAAPWWCRTSRRSPSSWRRGRPGASSRWVLRFGRRPDRGALRRRGPPRRLRTAGARIGPRPLRPRAGALPPRPGAVAPFEPMKVLFVYRYLTLGGVETVLRARLDGLARRGIEAHAWFFHDLGGRSVFTGREGTSSTSATSPPAPPSSPAGVSTPWARSTPTRSSPSSGAGPRGRGSSSSATRPTSPTSNTCAAWAPSARRPCSSPPSTSAGSPWSGWGWDRSR